MFNNNRFMEIMKFFPQENFKASVLRHGGDGNALTEFEISAPNKNDITIARNWELKKDQIYVFDKGYHDYNWWLEITESGSDFVTRAKKNAALEVVKSFEVRSEKAILGTQILGTWIFLYNKWQHNG